MNAGLVNFAINALVRLGHAGSAALAQHARDRAVLFPDLKQPHPNQATYVAGFFADPDRTHWVEGSAAPYADYWTTHGPDVNNPDAVAMLLAAAIKIRADEGVDLGNALSADPEGVAGAVLIEQWAAG